MQSMLDYPNLHDDLNEDEINDIFDHHGWKVELLTFDEYDTVDDGHLPMQHSIDEWPSLNSRGHPLYLHSPHKH